MNRYISTGTVLSLLLGTLLLCGLGFLVSLMRAEPARAAAPGFAQRWPEPPTPDAAQIPQLWKEFLAAADAGDLPRLRGYIVPGAGVDARAPGAQPLEDALCRLMVQAASAHRAAETRFGRLPAEYAAFFVHNDLDAATVGARPRISMICAIVPDCSDQEAATFVEIRQISGQWLVAVCQSPRDGEAQDSAAALTRRLDNTAEIFRAAAGEIQAGAYPSAQDAVLAIHGHLLRAGTQAAQVQ